MNSYEQFLDEAREITLAYKRRYWAAAGAVNKGTPPTPPPAPDPANVTSKTAAVYPLMKQIEAAATMGRKLDYIDPDTGEAKVADFTDVGEIDQALQQYMATRETAPMMAQDLLDMQKQFGTQFVDARREELAASDPEGFKARQELGQELLNQRMADTELPDAPNLEELSESELTAAGRKKLEESVYDNIGRSIVPGLLRRTQQAQRARGAASGNILGDGASLRESLAVQMAEEGQKSAALGMGLGLLQSGQTSSDAANRLRQANAGIRQQQYGNLMGQIGTRQGMRQQDISNLQGYAFGQPLTAQFGMLQGAQGGASPYGTIAPKQGMGMGDFYGQNASLMGSNFGSQASMYNAQLANQPDNPWMTGLGFAAGAFGGPMLGSLGSAAAGGILGGGGGGAPSGTTMSPLGMSSYRP